MRKSAESHKTVRHTAEKVITGQQKVYKVHQGKHYKKREEEKKISVYTT